ncbi:hypothetical protein F5Y01DRAFT_284019 [Xylaria sp. FL0043]|nr:hypothetical protein F5Y01DRAFT_284019 [Xylaria sp. FL0043]
MRYFSKIKGKLKRQAKYSGSGTNAVASLEAYPAGSPQSLGVDVMPPAPISPPVPTATATATSAPISNQNPPTAEAAHPDVWYDAYEEFSKREPELAKDYKIHLASVSKVDFSNPTWAKSFVEELQQSREAKQWHVSFHGKDIKFREQAEKLAKVLIWCNGVVKDALSAQPYAALAWSGVSIVLPLLTSATAQHEAMISHLDTVNHVQVYWKAYQDAFAEEFHVNSDSLSELYSHVFEYQARTICHLSSAQLSRAWQKVAGWNDWEKKAAHIERQSEHCKSLIDIIQAEETQLKSNQQLEQMYRSREALQKIYEILDEERKQRRHDRQEEAERKLLALLAADHEGYKSFNPRKVEGTCQWFLEDDSFRSWRDREESSFLWVSAGPGCGKSVLTRSLIDEWQLSTSPATSTVCYFFFKDGDAKRQHGANALSAILHQLFVQDLTGKFMSHALHRHRNYGKSLATNFSELWDILLDCTTTSDAGEIICVLDALDECNRNDRDEIISKLEDFFTTIGQASRRTCRLKFFITSRPYDTIEQSIGRFLNSSCLRIDGDDHSAAVSEDVNRVIDAKIPKMLSSFSESQRHQISEHLKGMENRTYLWLRLTFDIIEQRPSDYGRHSDVKKLLDNLPSEHSEAYEKILNQKNSPYTRPLFQLMLAAKEPLDIREANYALAMATSETSFTSHSEVKENIWSINDFKSKAKNFCGLLVDVHDSKLSFIHQTVREFLTESPQEGHEWKWRGRFNLPECHRVMALSCTRYLSLPEFDAPYDYKLPPAKETYPLFHYAACQWHFHYREQDTIPCNDLLEKARFLGRLHEGRPRMWTEYLEHICSIKGWTDLVLAAHYGLSSLVRAILDEEGGNIDADNESHDLALYEASGAGFSDIVEMLLLKSNANVHARSKSNYFNDIRLTPVFIAARNNRDRVVEILFERRGEQIEISEDLLKKAVRDARGMKGVSLLLEKAGKKAHVTSAIMQAAAENCWCGREMLDLLLKQRGEGIPISEEIVVAAAGNMRCSEEIMDLLLEKRGKQVQISEAILIKAARNDWSGDKILERLFEKREEQIQVTEAILIAAAKNREKGDKVLELLFEKRREQIQVTEAILKAAAQNTAAGKEIFELFFKQQGGKVEITEAVVIAAAGNPRGKETMTFLVGRWGDQIQITEAVLLAAARNHWGKDIMAFLYEKRGNQIQVTEAIVSEAVRYWIDVEHVKEWFQEVEGKLGSSKGPEQQ